jgi:starvation-inducible DNA-binding protein
MANHRAAETHTHRGNGSHHVPRTKAPPAPYGIRAPEVQPYGTLVRYPLGLGDDVRAQSVEDLNITLADTCVLRDMYKKHHWQTWGPTFYQLHLLFDKHYAEQAELVDKLAERVQTLGGVAIAMAHDIAELSEIERPPRGREEVPVQVSRLLEAHEHILIRSRAAARRAAERGDDGTNDLYVSDILRTHEMQVWFLAEHLENPVAAAPRGLR